MMTQAHAIAADRSRVPLVESGTEGVLPLSEEFSSESKLWALLEGLRGRKPTDEAVAVADVQPLLGYCFEPSIRTAVIRALRTEDPEHFSLLEVREAAFKALRPHIGEDTEVLKVFLQELESHPDNAASCKVAIEGLNNFGIIKDQQLCDRVLRLFLERHDDERYKPILKELAPNLGAAPSYDTARQLSTLADYMFRHTAAHSPLIWHAMAISNSNDLICQLCRHAAGEVYSGLNYGAVLKAGEGAVGGIGGIGTVITGFVSLFSGSPAPFLIGLALFWGIVPALTVAAVRKKYRVNNMEARLAAIDALSLAGGWSNAQETLKHLAWGDDGERSGEAARDSSNKMRPPFDLGAAKEALKHPSPKVRLTALRYLANMSEKGADEAIELCKGDGDKEVSREAYAIADARSKRSDK